MPRRLLNEAAAERCCCHLEAFCANRKEKHLHRALTMRNAALLMASLLLGSMALAGSKRATAQGPSEQFATAEAMRVIPKGGNDRQHHLQEH